MAISSLVERSLPLRVAIASLVTAAYVLAREAPSLAVRPMVVLTGAATLGMLVLWGLTELASRIPSGRLSATWLRRIAALVVVGGGLGWSAVRFALAREDLPAWAPATFVGGAAVATVLLFKWPWPARPDRARYATAMVVSATLLTGALVAMHEATGTLAAVRPGTELLHIALFNGTWLLSVGLVPPIALRFAPSTAPDGPRQWLLAGGVALFGVALMEVDRRALVGLYPDVHLWLLGLGLLCVDSGLRGLLEARTRRVVRLGGIAATALLVAGAATLVVGFGYARELPVRSRLAGSPVGASVLRIFPRASAGPVDVTGDHPALAFPRYFDDPPPGEKYNILLVTIDALRADALGPVDDPAPKMPRLHALAKESARFRHAYAQGARTAIGTGALMGGRYSANIDWSLWPYRGGTIYDPKTTPKEKLESLKGKAVYTTVPEYPPGAMLAERLKAVGYATAATPFAGSNDFFRAGVGFDRGFERFQDLTKKRWKQPTSSKVVEAALAQHEGFERTPWFQWVHLYDPHGSKGKRDVYDKLLGSTDEAFGRLLDELKERGEYDRTVIAVIADHGEAFGEHRQTGHASSLYDEQVRVPLVIRVPHLAGRDIQVPVAAIDLTATLVVLGRADTSGLDGLNLLPVMTRGEYPEERPVFTELHRYVAKDGSLTSDLKAVVVGRHKLIVDRLKGTAELYDLEADPGELEDRLEHEPDTHQRLNAILQSFLGAAEAKHPLP